jgi:4-hydroxy-2-oxoglutarate aldolase
MSHGNAKEIGGIYAPISTPFTADGAHLNSEQIKKNISAYNATNLAGYVVCGSTGEAILLTWGETEELFDVVAQYTGNGKQLIAGTGVDSLIESMERTKRAAELGYCAALVRTPHYYKPLMTDAALLNFYRRLADASPIPILVYSIPQFTGVEVSADLAAKLAEHGNIVGIKESSGRLETIRALKASTPANFKVLVGSAAIVEPSLKLGASGAILGLACVLPDLCAQIFELARAGKTGEAEALQQRLESASQIVSKYGPAGVKYAMDCRGLYGGPTRAPLLPLEAPQRQHVESVLAAFQPAITRSA